MAKTIERKIPAHKNIYMERSGKIVPERQLRVAMGIPDEGINCDTGMLVLVAGYGGGIDSNVFHKMRETLPDEYNFVVVQCQYFGADYMGAPKKITIPIENYGVHGVRYASETGETIEEFCDMGIMQALDIVTATKECCRYLREQKREVNPGKIIIFGTSHGAYLAYLANLICPHLYKYIFDVSAYLTPYYIHHTRLLETKYPDMTMYLEIKQFLYEHPEVCYDQRLYDLDFLYRNTQNNCRIIALQGTNDWMVDYRKKEEFIQSLGGQAQIMLISKTDVDGILFKHADHGLGMDFFQFFKMIMPILHWNGGYHMAETPEKVRVGNEEAYIIIRYEDEMPHVEEIVF